tara:strand:- start:244060 stop:244704 length:645 start_codon:yes stop_codon:yes gene_type:complete
MAVIIKSIRKTSESLRHLAQDEDGAGYTLSYVMAIPVLVMLVAMLVESAIMLTAKLGTVHAAYVAARVASVQATAGDWNAARDKIEKAGRQAMIPFASGSQQGSSSSPTNDSDYRKAYRQWADDPVADSYIQSKQRDVRDAVDVNIDGPPATWQSDLTVEVTYEYPFRIPGIGLLIGDASGDGYVFPLTSRVTLVNDGPQNDSQTLGIGYGSDQ